MLLAIKIQVCAEPISQPVLHEAESVKCVLVFNKIKNLDSSNFC
jgi:hypothetical protein